MVGWFYVGFTIVELSDAEVSLTIRHQQWKVYRDIWNHFRQINTSSSSSSSFHAARISLTLSCRPSLSSIAPGRSSRLHPVAVQSHCWKVLAGRPKKFRPCSQEYIAYEFIFTSSAVSCISDSSNADSFVMGGRWPYSYCFVGCLLRTYSV